MLYKMTKMLKLLNLAVYARTVDNEEFHDDFIMHGKSIKQYYAVECHLC